MEKRTSRTERIKRIRRKKRIRLAIILLVFIAIIALIIFGIVSCTKSILKPTEEQIPPAVEQQEPPTVSDAIGFEQNQETDEPQINQEEHPADQQTADPNTPEPPINEETDEPISSEPNTTGKTDYAANLKPCGAISKNAWNLILTNYNHYIPDGFQDSLVLKTYTEDYRVDARMLPYLQAMFKAAKQDGITLILRSAFRTHARQTELYNNRVQIYLDKGYSQKDAEEKAATINAYPGTSEHETGLAVDILSNMHPDFTSSFDRTPEYQWLISNCYKFGFILRYPADKKDIHKIIYEPWHYRFVGIENSYPIHEAGICLEEYLEKLG